ncbi:general stress protein [Salinicoccus sp. CNSTN-B1]
MKPFIRLYKDQDVFQKAVDTLITNNVNRSDIYILSYDYDYTKEIVSKMGINTAGVIEMGVKESINAALEERDTTMRKQFQDFGFSEDEAERYATSSNEGETVLIVTNNTNLEKYLD